MWCLVLELVGSLVKVPLSVGMEAFGLAFVYKCSFGVRSSMMVQILELSLLPLGFGPPLTVASRLLCPHSTEDKSHRLLAKPRFTARSYIEKREVGD